ncbi:MAG: DUF4331 family protein [Myxococcota bacterium]
MWTRIVPAVVAVVALVGAAAYFAQGQMADAADHADPPDRVAVGNSADISDIYAWHGGDTVKVILTFAGPVPPIAEGSDVGTYDPDVMYGIHIDEDADNAADHDIWVRFGQNAAGDWGIQVEGLPGTTEPVVGAVETTLETDGTMVFAGLRDDPFFFDLQGFMDTVANGTLAFDAERDFFAGQNITAIVLEFPQSELGSTTFGVWATTGTIN